MRDSATTIVVFVLTVAAIYGFTDSDLMLSIVTTLVFLGFAELVVSVIAVLYHTLIWAFFELQKEKDKD